MREIYREYGRLAYAVAVRALGDRSLAEEATQEAFVKAWRAAGALDDTRDLGPWLVTIVRRTAIDIHRRESLRATAPLEAVPADDPRLATLPASADAIYETWEVRQAVQELPDDEREVVRLQHFEGLTHGQIAERLGVAAGTVKSRSFRAHRRLATVLGHLHG